MKLGSQQHKELFCHSFIDTYLDYEPEKLPWPELDSLALDRLKGIPFWTEALYTERAAGVMVSSFANTIEDPLLREAIALQGREESRHARLIEYFLDYYDIKIEEPEKVEVTTVSIANTTPSSIGVKEHEQSLHSFTGIVIVLFFVLIRFHFYRFVDMSL